MRALVTSAFVVTLLVSAITVFLALRTDSLDGEPYASIEVKPPKALNAASRAIQTDGSVQPTVATRPATARRGETGETPQRLTSETDDTRTTAEDGILPRKPKPVTVNETQATRPSPSTRPKSEEGDDIVILPAEPGYGLSIGNLGPLEPASTTN